MFLRAIFSISVVAVTTRGSTTGNLTTQNDFKVVPEVGSSDLEFLYVVSSAFVEAVFSPFSEKAEQWFFDGVLNFVMGGWFSKQADYFHILQETVKHETGYLVCFGVGAVFVLLVPLVGVGVFVCRCCCGRCGGRLEQCEKRSRSRQRHCLCVTMLICTTLIIIPTVFVFMTNEYANSAIESAAQALNILSSNVDVTRSESEQGRNLESIRDFRESIGIRLRDFANQSAKLSISAGNDVTNLTQSQMIEVISSIVASVGEFSAGISNLKSNLSSLKEEMSRSLNVSSCNRDTKCLAVLLSVAQLNAGHHVNELDPLKDEVETMRTSLNRFDFKKLRARLESVINRIPTIVESQTRTASKSNEHGSIEEFIFTLSQSLGTAVARYQQNIGRATYFGGIAAGSALTFIAFCYVIGIILGCCGSNRGTPPSDRGCASNSGALWLMTGVVSSFLFSSILMLAVLFLLTVGGHVDTYVCQSPSFEAVEKQFGFNATIIFGAESEATFSEIFKSCSEERTSNDTIDEAGTRSEVISNLMSIKDMIDLSVVSVFNLEARAEILALQGVGFKFEDFENYFGILDRGITETDLPEYATFLRQSADDVNGTEESRTVRDYAAKVQQIHSTQVEPLERYADILRSDIEDLWYLSEELNITTEVLDDVMSGLNGSIASNPSALEKAVDEILDQIRNASEREISQMANAQSCKPFYTSYNNLFDIFCHSFVDPINGMCFSLGWATFILMPAAIFAMKLMKFYRKMNFGTAYIRQDMEMHAMW